MLIVCNTTHYHRTPHHTTYITITSPRNTHHHDITTQHTLPPHHTRHITITSQRKTHYDYITTQHNTHYHHTAHHTRHTTITSPRKTHHHDMTTQNTLPSQQGCVPVSPSCVMGLIDMCNVCSLTCATLRDVAH